MMRQEIIGLTSKLNSGHSTESPGRSFLMRSNVGLGSGEQRSAALGPSRRAETYHANMTNIRELNVEIVVTQSKKLSVINFSVVFLIPIWD